MKLHLEQGGGNNFIRASAHGQVTVNDTVYTCSLVVTPDRILADWGASNLASLRSEHFATIVGLAPQVVLLGTGERLRFPSPTVTRVLIEAGIGLEVMDTPAACRTYNILMAEGRRVAAALVIGGENQAEPK